MTLFQIAGLILVVIYMVIYAFAVYGCMMALPRNRHNRGRVAARRGRTTRVVTTWFGEGQQALVLVSVMFAPLACIFTTRIFDIDWTMAFFIYAPLAVVLVSVLLFLDYNNVEFRDGNDKFVGPLFAGAFVSWTVYGGICYLCFAFYDSVSAHNAFEAGLANVETECATAIEECVKMTAAEMPISRKVVVYHCDTHKLVSQYGSQKQIYATSSDDAFTIVFIRRKSAELVGHWIYGGHRKGPDAYRETVELLMVDYPEKVAKGRTTVVESEFVTGFGSSGACRWIEDNAIKAAP